MKKIICLIMVLVLFGCSKPAEEIEPVVEDNIDTANRLTKEVFDYINENDAELTDKLIDYQNGTTDKVDDPILNALVNQTIEYLVSELTADEVMEFGFDEVLWQLYDIDDALNPKDVEIITIDLEEVK